MPATRPSCRLHTQLRTRPGPSRLHEDRRLNQGASADKLFQNWQQLPRRRVHQRIRRHAARTSPGQRQQRLPWRYESTGDADGQDGRHSAVE